MPQCQQESQAESAPRQPAAHAPRHRRVDVDRCARARSGRSAATTGVVACPGRVPTGGVSRRLSAGAGAVPPLRCEHARRELERDGLALDPDAAATDRRGGASPPRCAPSPIRVPWASASAGARCPAGAASSQVFGLRAAATWTSSRSGGGTARSTPWTASASCRTTDSAPRPGTARPCAGGSPSCGHTLR